MSADEGPPRRLDVSHFGKLYPVITPEMLGLGTHYPSPKGAADGALADALHERHEIEARRLFSDPEDIAFGPSGVIEGDRFSIRAHMAPESRVDFMVVHGGLRENCPDERCHDDSDDALGTPMFAAPVPEQDAHHVPGEPVVLHMDPALADDTTPTEEPSMSDRPQITIQPVNRGGVEPYPWHIDEEGLVGRQEFWKGTPYRLAGFVDVPTMTGTVDVTLAEFWESPELALDMYPVFEHYDGSMFTHGGSRIAEVREPVEVEPGEPAAPIKWEERP